MTYLRICLVLWLFVTTGCGKGEKAGATAGRTGNRPVLRVVVKPVATRNVSYLIESVGTLEAEEEVKIPARVSGVVAKITVQEGDRVTPSTILAEIDPERYTLEVGRARASHERVQAEAKDAQQAYDQRMGLREKDPGWVTDEELRRYETALDRARAEEARTKAELDLSIKNREDARVKSPFSGIINARLVSTGEYVRPETPIATIADIQTLKLRFTIPEVDADRVTIGRPVTFTVRAHPNREFTGTVFFISTIADPATRVVEVKARTDNPEGLLKPGFFASVRLQAALHQAAVMVPEEAIIPTEVGFVTFIVVDGKARQRKVEIGLRDGGEVEILKGLTAGESLVVRGGHVLTDGIAVEISEE
ncbi:MAG: efflux RND transporter periplasmic adaptor subunit [Candidatus Latescibacteria bacterium]|nr:efflux RND transporter periplasmic adaptor subunit [Candidatus Latescibacterota bacterium]